jgi:putative ABC transport system substrate-binding protein
MTLIRRHSSAVLILIISLITCSSAQAQQPKKVPRIGFLSATSRDANSDRIEAFRDGLRDLGYVEGKNIGIEWRWAEGKFDELPVLAAELVNQKLDVIVASGPLPTRSLKEATNKVPIVMAQAGDPVGSGFARSLARPGGNITGLSTLAPEISGKRLELLKEIVPQLSQVAVLGTSTYPGNAQSVKQTELAAGAFGLKTEYINVARAKDITAAFQRLNGGRADAILVLTSPVFNSQRTQAVGLAAKSRLPTIFPQIEYVQEGGLMTYGVKVTESYRRAATYVDKILKGANPGEIPIEQPTKFELAINLKTAKQIGLTIPPNVLARADRVIR